jgi:hypothetical protein
MPWEETDEDRRGEEMVLTVYAYAVGGTYQLAPVASPWDADIAQAGTVRAVVEVKVRRIARGTYATYKIDQRKIEDLLTEADRRGVQAVLLVRFTDGLCRLLLTRAWLQRHATVSTLQRTGRAATVCYEWDNRWWDPVAED